MPVALTRYNTDERLTRVTSGILPPDDQGSRQAAKGISKDARDHFAFLGDEIYIKAGAEIPSRRHYGNYPQIEDGVGMVRSFVNAFENSCRNRAR